MEDILRQIKTVPGTLGCLVYDDDNRLLTHVFPGIFDQDTLSAAVATISENLPGLKELTGGVKMVDFRFQRGRVVVKVIERGCLVILSENDINFQSLIIALNLAVHQLEKMVALPRTVTPQAAIESKGAEPVSPVSPESLIENGALAPALQGMRGALAKFMGPMAQIIFLECVEKWLENNQPSQSSLSSLADIVAEELGDPAKMADYRGKVSTFLS